MVKRWLVRKEPGWRKSAIVNGLGALATAVVFAIILVTKFEEGGYIIVIALPIITLALWMIGRFYAKLKRTLHVSPQNTFDMRAHGASRTHVVVPVEEINLPTVMALEAACQRSRAVTAVHVNYDSEDDDSLIKRWGGQFPNIPLVVINSPYRTVAEPLAWYITDGLKEWHEATIMLPVIKVSHFWERPLVNQSLGRLRGLLRRKRTVEFVEQPFAVG